MIPESLIKKMEEKMAYRFVGPNKHSAIKVCTWTKHSLTDKGSCYKQQFYGIDSSRCIQMTPAVPFCTQRCEFCWRLRELCSPEWIGPVDEPDIILNEAIEARRIMITGFSGQEKSRSKMYLADRPNQVAISLDGEPLLYPKINELIEEIRVRGMTAFLVTNGTLPNVLKNLSEPTNLYITLAAPNKEVHEKTCQPLINNAWDKLQESLSLLQNFSCVTVIRLTLVRGLNMIYPEQYAKIIEKTNPRYVEVKSFMSVAAARQRLPYSAMPLHNEIMDFAYKIAEESGFRLVDENKPSRVALLKR